MDELFPLFFSNLEDSIPSVRQGGAVAIANVVRAYGMYNVNCGGSVCVLDCHDEYHPSGAEVEDKVFSVLKERLPLAVSQPASTSGEMSVYIA